MEEGERGVSMEVLPTLCSHLAREEPYGLHGACGCGAISAPPALLCFWIQPLEDGNVLGHPPHAGNHRDPALETGYTGDPVSAKAAKNTDPMSLKSKSQAENPQPSAPLHIPGKGSPFRDW